MTAPKLDSQNIEALAKRYLWWKTPEEIAERPDLLIAQIMNIGTWEDVVTLESVVAPEQLRHVLTHATGSIFRALLAVLASAFASGRRGQRAADAPAKFPVSVFDPLLSKLPQAQQAVWPSLRPAQELGFVLYGGTAVALRLGHRVSVDFDFFTERHFSADTLRRRMPVLADAQTIEATTDTLTLSVVPEAHIDPVKLSFFGGIGFGRVDAPEQSRDGVLWAASLLDLMATKLKVLHDRVSARDYIDLAAPASAPAPRRCQWHVAALRTSAQRQDGIAMLCLAGIAKYRILLLRTPDPAFRQYRSGHGCRCGCTGRSGRHRHAYRAQAALVCGGTARMPYICQGVFQICYH